VEYSTSYDAHGVWFFQKPGVQPSLLPDVVAEAGAAVRMAAAIIPTAPAAITRADDVTDFIVLPFVSWETPAFPSVLTGGAAREERSHKSPGLITHRDARRLDGLPGDVGVSGPSAP
jgi:hypothetical protein